MPEDQLQPTQWPESAPAHVSAPAAPPKKSKTALILGVVLAAVVVGAGIGGYLLWQQNQQLSADNEQLTTDKTALRRQLAAAEATPTPTPTPTPAPLSPVSIKEFGVTYTPTPDIKDVSYTYNASVKVVYFHSAALSASAPACSADGALGGLTRVSKGKTATLGSDKVATVGSYDYYFTAPQSTCDASATAAAQQSQTSNAIKAALASLH